MEDDPRLSSSANQGEVELPMLVKPQKPGRLVWFGHITAILPVAAFLFMPLWYGLCVYDQSEDLIGPAWLLRLGGEDFVVWPIRACLVTGIVCFVAGLIGRRVLTVCEGLWCFCAYFVLMFLFMLSQF